MKTSKGSSKENLAAGSLMIAAGLLFLCDRIIGTGWLTLAIFPVAGLGLLVLGLKFHSVGWRVGGSLVFGIGLAIFFLLNGIISAEMLTRIGLALLAFAVSWVLVALQSLMDRKISWWGFIPAAVFGSIGYCLWTGAFRLVDYIFYLFLILGVVFIAWGSVARLFGLIIPGCLLVTIGPGIYFAWGASLSNIALAQIGIMLACFAFGWGLITLFSRRIYEHTAWWPMIPGGILAVTGWGLYISGDPGNALSFIGNTGTIGLVIFGLYLILMRRGIRQ